MSEDRRKVVLEVNKECYSLVEEYSEYVNESERNVLNRLLNYTLEEYADKYKKLKKGYKKMGQINLEISQAFTASENEVFNRIDDDFESKRGERT